MSLFAIHLGLRARHGFAAAVLGLLGMTAMPSQAQACYNAGDLVLNFGTVSAGGTQDVTGTASYRCEAPTATTKYRVCLYMNEGPGGSADMSGTNPRRMTNYNGGSINYTLYTAAARTQVLAPEGSGYAAYSSTLTVPYGQTHVMLNIPVYGRVSAPANAAAANYQAQFNGVVLRYAWSTNGPDPSGCTAPNPSSTPTYFRTQAQVSGSCTVSISTNTLNFGSTPALSSGVIDAVSSIFLSCPPNVSWQLGLNDGLNALGGQRRMAGPAGGYIAYELYKDAARSQRWGNSTGVDTLPKPASQSNPLTVPVYGRVLGAQTQVIPGQYKDTVVVTLTY